MQLPSELHEREKFTEYSRLRVFQSQRRLSKIGFDILLWAHEMDQDRGGWIYDVDLKNKFGIEAYKSLDSLEQKGWVKGFPGRCKVTESGAVAGEVLQETEELSKPGKYYFYAALTWVLRIVSFRLLQR